MGTPHFIKRHLNQTLVYWGNPQPDGEGGYDFDNPVEISGRCEYRMELTLNASGEEAISRATVWLDREVEEGGYLYLGTLSDSVIGDDQQPETTKGTMRILSYRMIPRLQGPGNLYKAYCNVYGAKS